MSAPACWMLGRSSVLSAFHRSPVFDEMTEWLPWSFASSGYDQDHGREVRELGPSPEGR